MNDRKKTLQRLGAPPQTTTRVLTVTAILSLTVCALATATFVPAAHAQSASEAPPITPAMLWLAKLPAAPSGEAAMGRLFAHGTATYVPTGESTGYPVSFNRATDLDWLFAELWGGKTFRVVSDTPYPNGDPVVQLDNKIIMTPSGALINAFDAWVTRGPVPELLVGINGRGEKVKPPTGQLSPIYLSFLSDPVTIDNKPSVILNYFIDQSLPIIRRVLDEIREVDGVNCKGLFLGRAHIRRCTSLDCGEYPVPLVDFPNQFSFKTHVTWNFWTYFLLNFGQPAGTTCDISQAIHQAEQELGMSLPVPPAAQ